MMLFGFWLFFGSCLAVVVSSEDFCEDNWVEHDDMCYYMSLTVEETEVTWYEARTWCLEQGGDLTSILTQNETELVYLMAEAEGYEGDLWIGLNQLHQDDFLWSDGTTSDHTDWERGHPIEDGLNKCAYQKGIPKKECFELENHINSIKGVLYYPWDADFYDTFYFGYTYSGWMECRDECIKYPRCRSFAYFEPGYYDPVWNWYSYMCAGRSDFMDVRYPEPYVTSGFLEECEPEGSWFSANCGLKKGFVCKKLPGDVTPKPITPTPAVPGYCPEGYFGVDNKCFLMVEGIHGFDWQWDEARELCRSVPNGDLASIQTPEQNAAITSRLQQFSMSYWIGYYVHDSHWIWADNSQPRFENWAKDKPDGSSDSCAEIWTEGPEAGRWNTRSCVDWRGYICQVYKDEDEVISTPPSTTPHSCAEGWTPYWSGCYRVENTALTWQEAQQRCHDKDSELVSFVAAAENAAVSLLASNHASYWIGLRKSAEGAYAWEDGWPLVYTNWAAGEPGSGEGFVSVDADGKWVDAEGGQHFASVCKTTEVPPPTTPAQIEGVCVGPGWEPYGSHCYYFGNHLNYYSWDEARLACHSHGNVYHPDATLASVHSVAENDFIRQRARNASMFDPWIGLHRRDEDSEFEWTDGSPVDFMAWGPGEPNDDDGTQLCVEMYVHNWPGLWNDHMCSDWMSSRSYVCKAAKVLNPTSIPTTPPNVPGTCPGDSWVHWDKYCYLFKPNEDESWTDARMECIRQGGQAASIASIHSDQENYFVLYKLMEIADDYWYKATWIGLHKEPRPDGEWKWSDDSEVVYTNWADGEPSDVDGTENCVEMYIDESNAETGGWNDVSCSDRQGYVCKVMKEGIPPGFSSTTEGTGEEDDDNSGGLSAGEIVGIVFGVLIGVALVGGAVFGGWYFFLRGSPSKATSNGTASFSNTTYGDLEEDFDDLARRHPNIEIDV